MQCILCKRKTLSQQVLKGWSGILSCARKSAVRPFPEKRTKLNVIPGLPSIFVLLNQNLHSGHEVESDGLIAELVLSCHYRLQGLESLRPRQQVRSKGSS